MNKKKFFFNKYYKYRWQYFMIALGIICLILFNYIPMAGIQIAFKNYKVGRSTIWNAEFVGLDNFWFLYDSEFWRIVRNTLTLTISKFIFTFPAPIILAILVNEIQNTTFKRIVQSITYIPHFISWVVVAYMLQAFLSPYDGVINSIIKALGGTPIFFLGDTKWFVPLFVIASIWKEVGWGTIVYLAAITNIEQEMYEAAKLDGAGRWNQIRYITLPCIVPTISMLFILALPGILNAGVDAVYPLINNANMEVATTLDVYILNNGLQRGKYSLSTAVGLMQSVLGLILILIANKASEKLTGDGLW